MPYRLIVCESVQDGIRRIMSEQIDGALSELADSSLDPARTVHQVRKRCKKIRATLRLFRGALGKAYAVENARYGDVARRISDVRDAQVMVESCDALAKDAGDQVDAGLVRSIRQRLVAGAKKQDADRIATLLQDVESDLKAGHERVASLRVAGKGHEGALAGMCRAYSRGCAARAAICDVSTPEAFHAWRKWVKRHWYHMCLLRDVWPAAMRARRNESAALGELLGDHHDLCVLRAWLLNNRDSFTRQGGLKDFIHLVNLRIAQMERTSMPLGRRLYAEKPKHFARRFGVYFSLWSEDGRE